MHRRHRVHRGISRDRLIFPVRACLDISISMIDYVKSRDSQFQRIHYARLRSRGIDAASDRSSEKKKKKVKYLIIYIDILSRSLTLQKETWLFLQPAIAIELVACTL